MTYEGEKPYQKCREMREMSREYASEMIGVEPETLGRYERGEVKPSMDKVANMCRVYNMPSLAWWYVKYETALGTFFPAAPSIKSEGDMGFQTVLAKDEAERFEQIGKKILADGVITKDELPDLDEYIRTGDSLTSRTTQATNFAKKIRNQHHGIIENK